MRVGKVLILRRSTCAFDAVFGMSFAARPRGREAGQKTTSEGSADLGGTPIELITQRTLEFTDLRTTATRSRDPLDVKT